MTSDPATARLMKQGLIKKCPPDAQTAGKLIRRAILDLKTARRNLDEDPECTFTYAYRAMMRRGLALMLSRGFRPAAVQKHQTIVTYVETAFVDRHEAALSNFDVLRRKRNRFIYEPDLPCSWKEADEALKTAEDFVAALGELISREQGQPGLDFSKNR